MAALAATTIPIPLQPRAIIIMRSILLPACAFILISALRHIGSRVVHAVATIIVALRLALVATLAAGGVREMLKGNRTMSSAYPSLVHHNQDLLVIIIPRRAGQALLILLLESVLLMAMCIVIIVYGRASQSADVGTSLRR